MAGRMAGQWRRGGGSWMGLKEVACRCSSCIGQTRLVIFTPVLRRAASPLLAKAACQTEARGKPAVL